VACRTAPPNQTHAGQQKSCSMTVSELLEPPRHARPGTFAVFMLIDNLDLVGSYNGAIARVLGCARQ
jgi:hypothetical protein